MIPIRAIKRRREDCFPHRLFWMAAVTIVVTGAWLGSYHAGLFVSAAPRAAARAERPLAEGSAPVLSVKVVKIYPHDPEAFTQGLEFYDGFLYESTGLRGKSSLRKADIATGRVLQSVLLPSEYFGEGLTIFHGKIYQLTWLSKTGFIYDLRSFRKTGEFRYESEGWGLTHDEHSLILSDGTNQIQFIDPATFQVQRRLEVYAGREAVVNLNELEYINGLIYANIWHSPRIRESTRARAKSLRGLIWRRFPQRSSTNPRAY